MPCQKEPEDQEQREREVELFLDRQRPDVEQRIAGGRHVEVAGVRAAEQHVGHEHRTRESGSRGAFLGGGVDGPDRGDGHERDHERRRGRIRRTRRA